ncbi:MAG: FHA domain-containing protein [Gammaproteobacteria bacterium]|nr:adenylate/guanylate cyclase domain-containing protein [Gammaproteobacteria bacterium]NIP89093.1 adenylate/guanylate cyclase domain-containing protein [Gammaproteobacteria bacterium]NIR23953.1 adenylate/guanylate cyclase domain-containing protein [Gammaproteobacteria bacterium]NIS05587.1 adenylate/guanylate cyclase domain-containing protein [Gammaproteobacteria bacterium]NIU40901.1 FHA domain-containing protein [Gammaproteobacteria bacterium]
MAKETASRAIVFADISGSTRLYETLGDTIARELVSQCLDLMTEQVNRHNGAVIKTIGDEIMSTFATAEQAVEACVAMQESVAEDLPHRNKHTPADFSIRIGMHYGSCILEGGDVFGDAVNVAARMAGIAKGGQIITTQDTAAELSPATRSSTRHLDRIPIKGKSEDVDIFEVIWQADDVTRMATGLLAQGVNKLASLRLRYHAEVMDLDQNMNVFILGRGQKADMVVNDSMASREHARIECRRGKFILTDMSTNGTYVETAEGPSYLRREDIVLTGRGKIALGRDLGEATEYVVFDCR